MIPVICRTVVAIKFLAFFANKVDFRFLSAKVTMWFHLLFSFQICVPHIQQIGSFGILGQPEKDRQKRDFDSYELPVDLDQ